MQAQGQRCKRFPGDERREGWGGWAAGGGVTDLLHRGCVLFGLCEVGGLYPEAHGVAGGVHRLEP